MSGSHFSGNTGRLNVCLNDKLSKGIFYFCDWLVGPWSGQGANDSNSNFMNDGYNDRVAKLFVSLRVGNGYHKPRLKLCEPHKGRALRGRQSSRILIPLWDKNLGPVFVVSRTQRSRTTVQVSQTISKAISFFLMLLRIHLQIVPEMIG